MTTLTRVRAEALSPTGMSLSSSPAGPSLSSSPPPPQAIQTDDYAAADAARTRVNKRLSLLSSLSLPSLHRHKSPRRKQDARSNSTRRSSSDSVSTDRLQASSLPLDGYEPVQLADAGVASVELDQNYDKDVYRWAVLYENQRG